MNVCRTHEKSNAIVFFGATGDLAYKQIFPALHAMVRRGHLKEEPIIGVAKTERTPDQLRATIRKSLEDHGGIDPQALATLMGLFRYVHGDYRDPATFTRLGKALGSVARPLYYLAIPPSMFTTVIEGLARFGCVNGARIVIEKPFGRDLTSPQAAESHSAYLFPGAGHFPHRPLPGKRAGTKSDVFPIRQSNL